MQHLRICEADDVVSVGTKDGLAMCVALCDFRVEMDLTVYFDNEFALCTIEVWEVA
jgi:hypothetical protein